MNKCGVNLDTLVLLTKSGNSIIVCVRLRTYIVLIGTLFSNTKEVMPIEQKE